ncbi:Kinase-like protein [Pleurostoma richardsiae]|uniref:Kinase-like protein n=1 Tax=Pleurostoma richardsiae TaxID=41990 RepID=A0AA38RR09_9PEZI|nr:Kinase-like protein [Pleurostoma richardsiae]
MAVSAVLPLAVTQTSTLDSSQSSSQGDSSQSSSPRQFPTDLSSPILEEGDESESEPPNEPVTPVSGRQSQDFNALQNHDTLRDAADGAPVPYSTARPKPPLILNTAPTPPAKPRTSTSNQEPPSTPATANATERPPSPTISRRSTRAPSTSGFKRTMSSIFRRSNSQTNAQVLAMTQALNTDSEANLPDDERKVPARRWSMNRSSATTRSNTPPSPSSPTLEMAKVSKEHAASPTLPSTEDFYSSKKTRAATGLSLRSRAVNFVVSGSRNEKPRPSRRRASSFDASTPHHPHVHYDPNNPTVESHRQILWMAADAGVGVKARRLSLSLPDEFAVDVAELLSEFEYHHKFLGRHGRHVGKGATSKVTLMIRKGSPGELYAVKEFRGKSSSETKEEYEKKIKSEFSIAKSLHHPNIVETVRLCTNHGRWNHVMEYCSEGDLFSLVQKGYLKTEARQADRLCLFKQLVQGLAYLHNNGIAHRDIKLENLLITKDSKLKITDFGVSEVFCGIHPGLREAGGQCGINMGEIRLCAPGICGSEPYIAPEVLEKKEHYDPRALDVWGAAIVMINLIFGAPIWERAKLEKNDNYAALVKGWEKWNAKHPDDEQVFTDTDYPNVLAFDMMVKPPALRRVLLRMLNPNPKKRCTITDVMNNRWVKNVECCQLDSYDDPAKLIDASKKHTMKVTGSKKIFCHNHLPPQNHGSHSLGKMPGQPGY